MNLQPGHVISHHDCFFPTPRYWHRADWSRRARGEQCHPGPLRQSTGNGNVHGGASTWRCQNINLEMAKVSFPKNHVWRFEGHFKGIHFDFIQVLCCFKEMNEGIDASHCLSWLSWNKQIRYWMIPQRKLIPRTLNRWMLFLLQDADTDRSYVISSDIYVRYFSYISYIESLNVLFHLFLITSSQGNPVARYSKTQPARFGMARWFVSPWALLVWFTTIPSNSPRMDDRSWRPYKGGQFRFFFLCCL